MSSRQRQHIGNRISNQSVQVGFCFHDIIRLSSILLFFLFIFYFLQRSTLFETRDAVPYFFSWCLIPLSFSKPLNVRLSLSLYLLCIVLLPPPPRSAPSPPHPLALYSAETRYRGNRTGKRMCLWACMLGFWSCLFVCGRVCAFTCSANIGVNVCAWSCCYCCVSRLVICVETAKPVYVLHCHLVVNTVYCFRRSLYDWPSHICCCIVQLMSLFLFQLVTIKDCNTIQNDLCLIQRDFCPTPRPSPHCFVPRWLPYLL